MTAIVLFWQIFIWHYTIAPIQIVKIWKDFVWFLYHYFSIRLLTKTLFSCWRRLGEVRHKRLDIGDFLATHFVNAVMRIIGFFIRVVTIIIGLMSIAVLVVLGGMLCILWFFIPIITIALGVIGWNLLWA